MSSDKASKFFVTFWGTRGSVATPGRLTEKYGGNTPCVSIQHENTHIIIDAGTGIRGVGHYYEEEFREKGTTFPLHLLLSHTHWDHIQGLPFFDVAYMEDANITIYGSPNKERLLGSIIKDQMDLNYFPVSFSEIAAKVEIQEIAGDMVQIGSINITWQEQIFHPGGSVRYGLQVGNRRIVYATDIELDRIARPGFEEADSEKHLREYMEFIEGENLLIADGQYAEEEYERKKGWGHTSIPIIVDIASRARVKQLAIFHHDPKHSDKDLDDLWKVSQNRLKKSDHAMIIFWAREGMTLAI